MCLVPIVLCLLLVLVVYVLFWLRDKRDMGDDDRARYDRQLYRTRLIRLLVFSLLLIYPGTCAQLFNLLQCREVRARDTCIAA